jgi:cytochrome c oxidase subunit 2
MQMKIIVDTPEDYKAWLKDKATVVNEVKAALASETATTDGAVGVDSTKAGDSAKVVAVMPVK